MNKNSKFKKTEIGEIPEDWEVKKIGDLVKINEKTVNKNYSESVIEYIDTSSVEKGQLIGIQRLNLCEAPSRAKRILKDRDILISTVRPNLKHFFFIEKTKKNLIGSTGFVVISSKDINPRFLYYFLTNKEYTQFLSSIADSHTSTYPSFNPEIIENSLCPYPELKEQQAIAKILSDLDSRIESNNKTNKILEETGQAIFKKWFINEAKDGWEISTIGKEVKTVLGGTPSRTKEEYWNGNINWINSGKVNEFRIIEPSEKITEEGLKKSATSLLPKGTVVLAITGATLGQVSRLEIDSCANQSVIGVLENKKFSSEYLYYSIKKKITEIIGFQTGGAQQHINKGNVDNFELTIPDEKTLSKFNSLAKPIFNSISNNCFQNLVLSQIRDSLLPKLMSGKIRVPLEIRR